ncbi:MAG: hypothetical protein LBH70_07095 [Spirochaetaceae bacterium]|jgi:uncharacterized integral membrane protein|nr:hypothetical protein [Spirochaetaceae bacterium]
MVLKFIGFVVLCAVFLVFIGFNLENKCDISFGFAMLSDVPVFLTAFVSFAAGLLAAVPVAISIQLRKNRKQKEETRPAKRGRKKRGKDAETSPEGAAKNEESGGKDDGAYGID